MLLLTKWFPAAAIALAAVWLAGSLTLAAEPGEPANGSRFGWMNGGGMMSSGMGGYDMEQMLSFMASPEGQAMIAWCHGSGGPMQNFTAE